MVRRRQRLRHDRPRWAHNVAFEDCEIATSAATVSGSAAAAAMPHLRSYITTRLRGVRIGRPASAPTSPAHGHITVDNCIIHQGGRIDRGCVAVFIAQSGDNKVTHNDIATSLHGISVGWTWGYSENLAKRNTIDSTTSQYRLGRPVR